MLMHASHHHATMPNTPVDNMASALSMANIIQHHAAESGKGLTYAQMGRFAVESGCDSFRQIRNELGVASTCGQCKRDACRVIREHKNEMSCASALVGAD